MLWYMLTPRGISAVRSLEKCGSHSGFLEVLETKGMWSLSRHQEAP